MAFGPGRLNRYIGGLPRLLLGDQSGKEEGVPEPETSIVGGRVHAYVWAKHRLYWDRHRQEAEPPPVIKEIPETIEYAELVAVPKVPLEDIPNPADRELAETIRARNYSRTVELAARIEAELERQEIDEIMAVILMAAA